MAQTPTQLRVKKFCDTHPDTFVWFKQARMLSTRTEMFSVDLISEEDHSIAADSLPFLCLMLSETFRKHNQYEKIDAGHQERDIDRPQKRMRLFKGDWVLPFSKIAIQNVASMLKDEFPTLKTTTIESMIETVKMWQFMLLPEECTDLVVAAYWLSADTTLTENKLAGANKLLSLMNVHVITHRVLAKLVTQNFDKLSDSMKGVIPVNTWCSAVNVRTDSVLISPFYVEVMKKYIPSHEWAEIFTAYARVHSCLQNCTRMDFKTVLDDSDTIRPGTSESIWLVIGQTALKKPVVAEDYRIVTFGQPQTFWYVLRTENLKVSYYWEESSDRHTIRVNGGNRASHYSVSIVSFGLPATFQVNKERLDLNETGHYKRWNWISSPSTTREYIAIKVFVTTAEPVLRV